jgi:hypothetical protein
MPLEQTIPIVYYKRQSPLILAIDFLYPYPPPNIRTSYNENILRIVEILTIEGVQAATWVNGRKKNYRQHIGLKRSFVQTTFVKSEVWFMAKVRF